MYLRLQHRPEGGMGGLIPLGGGGPCPLFTTNPSRAAVPLGACVLTASGAGVVVGFRRAEPEPSIMGAKGPAPPRHVYVVRLWNRIGSDGSVRCPVSRLPAGTLNVIASHHPWEAILSP